MNMVGLSGDDPTIYGNFDGEVGRSGALLGASVGARGRNVDVLCGLEWP